MSKLETFTKNFQQLTAHANEKKADAKEDLNQFFTKEMINSIRSNVGVNLKHYGFIDEQTKSMLFIGQSNPNFYHGYGLPKETADKIKKLNPNFYVLAKLNIPNNLKGFIINKLISKSQNYSSMSSTPFINQWPFDLPLHLQIAVTETREKKSFTFPPSPSDAQIKQISQQLPLLHVIENITDQLEPILNEDEFRYALFTSKDTHTFLTPELSNWNENI